MEGGAGQRRDRGARARDVLSAGKRYTLLARIAARGDLGPRRSGLPRGVFFPAVDGEKSTTKNPRDGASARTETVDGGRPRRGDRLRSGDSGSSRTRRFRSLGFSRTSLPGVGGTTAGAGRNARQPTVASRDGAISPETHLGGTALDDHESALANGTGLHGDGGGRAGIGGLEFLDVGVVRHGWMLRLLGRVPCAAGKGLYRECLRLLGARTDEDPAPIVCMVRQSGEIPSVFTKMANDINFECSFPECSSFSSSEHPPRRLFTTARAGWSPDATDPGGRTGGCEPPRRPAFVPLGSLAFMRRALDRVARARVCGALFRTLRARLGRRERERALRRPTAFRRRE